MVCVGCYRATWLLKSLGNRPVHGLPKLHVSAATPASPPQSNCTVWMLNWLAALPGHQVTSALTFTLSSLTTLGVKQRVRAVGGVSDVPLDKIPAVPHQLSSLAVENRDGPAPTQTRLQQVTTLTATTRRQEPCIRSRLCAGSGI